MILFLTLFIGDIKPSQPVELKPGVPVPGAPILDQILVKNNIINSSNANDGSVFDFLFGDDDTIANKYNSENLDVSVLDYQTVHKIVEVAKKNFVESRRQFRPLWLIERESYWKGPFFVSKSFDLMKQSIYATRYRLEATKPYRKHFSTELSYNVGVLYGSLTTLILKMDNMYSQMRALPLRTHFIWYLIFYEKILAAHVDATSMMHRMFEYQKKFVEETRAQDYEAAMEREDMEPNRG